MKEYFLRLWAALRGQQQPVAMEHPKEITPCGVIVVERTAVTHELFVGRVTVDGELAVVEVVGNNYKKSWLVDAGVAANHHYVGLVEAFVKDRILAHYGRLGTVRRMTVPMTRVVRVIDINEIVEVDLASTKKGAK